MQACGNNCFLREKKTDVFLTADMFKRQPHKLFLAMLLAIMASFIIAPIMRIPAAYALAGDAETQDELLKLTSKPQMHITIPGITFSDPKIITEGDKTYLSIPYLGEYIAQMYRYVVALAAVISVMVIIFAGFSWTMSGGDSEAIGHAKDMIGRAVIGLVLAVGSYTVLYAVNPNLVKFQNLKILYIAGVGLDSLVIEDKDILDETTLPAGTARPITNTEFDPLFRAFANCIGVDWHVLKVFAYKESSLNPTIQNKLGFTGLFQTKPVYCASALSSYPEWADECDDLKNPVVNTAVGAMMLQSGLKKVKKCSPKPAVIDAGALLYLNHNSGGGALNYILAHNGCQGGTAIRDGIVEFWDTYKNGQFKEKHLGEKRFPYAYDVGRLIEAQGVTDVFSIAQNGSDACPLVKTPENYGNSHIELSDGRVIRLEQRHADDFRNRLHVDLNNLSSEVDSCIRNGLTNQQISELRTRTPDVLEFAIITRCMPSQFF